jgi:hypothetical protein
MFECVRFISVCLRLKPEFQPCVGMSPTDVLVLGKVQATIETTSTSNAPFKSDYQNLAGYRGWEISTETNLHPGVTENPPCRRYFDRSTSHIPQVIARRHVIPLIQSAILVFGPRSQRSIWAMGLVLRFLRCRDALLGFFIHQISPPKGLYLPEPIPQLREALDITNTVRNNLLGIGRWLKTSYKTAMFSPEQSLPFLLRQLPVR